MGLSLLVIIIWANLNWGTDSTPENGGWQVVPDEGRLLPSCFFLSDLERFALNSFWRDRLLDLSRVPTSMKSPIIVLEIRHIKMLLYVIESSQRGRTGNLIFHFFVHRVTRVIYFHVSIPKRNAWIERNMIVSFHYSTFRRIIRWNGPSII
jgi:hypothetical protein